MNHSDNHWRFTGENPPPELIERIPNWELALDEEDVEGQDESTLKPEGQQRVISSFTAFTAGTATLSNGRPLPVLLEMHEGAVWAIDVYDPKGEWRLIYDHTREHWRCYVESWLPAPERTCRIVESTDGDIFPLRVSSALPLEDKNERWEIMLEALGS